MFGKRSERACCGVSQESNYPHGLGSPPQLSSASPFMPKLRHYFGSAASPKEDEIKAIQSSPSPKPSISSETYRSALSRPWAGTTWTFIGQCNVPLSFGDTTNHLSGPSTLTAWGPTGGLDEAETPMLRLGQVVGTPAPAETWHLQRYRCLASSTQGKPALATYLESSSSSDFWTGADPPR